MNENFTLRNGKQGCRKSTPEALAARSSRRSQHGCEQAQQKWHQEHQ